MYFVAPKKMVLNSGNFLKPGKEYDLFGREVNDPQVQQILRDLMNEEN